MPVFFLDAEVDPVTSVSAESRLGTAVHFEATAGAEYSSVICTHGDPCPWELCWWEWSVNRSWLPGVLSCQTLDVLCDIKNKFFSFLFFSFIEVVQSKLNNEGSFQILKSLLVHSLDLAGTSHSWEFLIIHAFSILVMDNQIKGKHRSMSWKDWDSNLENCYYSGALGLAVVGDGIIFNISWSHMT